MFIFFYTVLARDIMTPNYLLIYINPNKCWLDKSKKKRHVKVVFLCGFIYDKSNIYYTHDKSLAADSEN